MTARSRFDRAYYERFYRDPETRVIGPGEQRKLVRFVHAYLRFLDIPVTTVLDVGCGLGGWKDALRAEGVRARYHGLEVSPHLCRELGWERGSVVDWDSGGRRFDLVVCQGVLQYLPARDARRAIRNLARWTAGALYLEVLTRRDWEESCEQSTTDGEVYLRTGDWYRGVLGRHFRNGGGGVFLPRDGDTVLFELESC